MVAFGMLQDGECFRYCGQVCVKVRRIAENPGYGLYSRDGRYGVLLLSYRVQRY